MRNAAWPSEGPSVSRTEAQISSSRARYRGPPRGFFKPPSAGFEPRLVPAFLSSSAIFYFSNFAPLREQRDNLQYLRRRCVTRGNGEVLPGPSSNAGCVLIPEPRSRALVNFSNFYANDTCQPLLLINYTIIRCASCNSGRGRFWLGWFSRVCACFECDREYG